MEKLGIVVDALEIQEIEDSSGYINNLAAPHAAAVASQARIAKARADQEATERELAAAAMKAQFERDTAIKRAGFQAETEEANARAAQAGPLAQAQASQQVIQQQTAPAQRQAELAAQRLEAEVRRPADAEAYRKRTLAEADRDQARFAAEAMAFSKRTIAEAEAEANKARAASLREGNQELIAANRLVEVLPALVEAAARGLADSNLTILSGTQGVNEVVAGLVGQGLSILDTLKQSVAIAGHGATPAPVCVAPGGSVGG
jgi:flotillin